jgi:hypothetical protein
MKDLKMIKVEIRLWTNDLGENGEVSPGAAWDSGTITVPVNKRHGIKSGTQVRFDSIAQVSGAVERALIDAGVTLYHGRVSGKYFAK